MPSLPPNQQRQSTEGKSTIQASYERAMIARPSYDRGYRPSCAEHRDWLEVSGWSQVLRSCRLSHSQSHWQLMWRHCPPYIRHSTTNSFETFTLFSRVTLIRKLQSISDLDHFHARELPCSRVKSRDDPISGRRGDSGVLFSFIYKDKW